MRWGKGGCCFPWPSPTWTADLAGIADSGWSYCWLHDWQVSQVPGFITFPSFSLLTSLFLVIWGLVGISLQNWTGQRTEEGADVMRQTGQFWWLLVSFTHIHTHIKVRINRCYFNIIVVHLFTYLLFLVLLTIGDLVVYHFIVNIQMSWSGNSFIQSISQQIFINEWLLHMFLGARGKAVNKTDEKLCPHVHRFS